MPSALAPAQTIALALVYRPDTHSVLMIHRNDEQNGSRWCFPGGKVEVHSDASGLSAAKRELDEETGAKPDKVVLLKLQKHPRKDVLVYYTYMTIGSEAAESVLNKEPDKHRDVKWVPVTDVGSLTLGDISPPFKALVDSLSNGRPVIRQAPVVNRQESFCWY